MFKKMRKNLNKEFISFICPKCNTKEDISLSIVDMLDKCDNENNTYLPKFDCQNCNL